MRCPGCPRDACFHAAHRALLAKWPDLRPKPSPVRAALSRSRRLAAGAARRLAPVAASSAAASDLLHEARLDTRVTALARRAEGGQAVEVWLTPRDDNRAILATLVERCRTAGLRVERAELVTPPTAEVPPVIADARARHRCDGGSWPVADLARLVVALGRGGPVGCVSPGRPPASRWLGAARPRGRPRPPRP